MPQSTAITTKSGVTMQCHRVRAMKIFKKRVKVDRPQPDLNLKRAPAGTIPISSLVDLALEIWRVEGRCKKLLASDHNKDDLTLRFSMEKIRHSLRTIGLEIKDPFGEHYQEGLSLDVLAFDCPDCEPLEHRIVQETISRAIYFNGQLVKLAQVIVGVQREGQAINGASNG